MMAQWFDQFYCRNINEICVLSRLADFDELQVGFIPVDELSQSIEHFICRPVIDPFT